MRRRDFMAGMTTTAIAIRPTTLTAQTANKPALIGVLAGASRAGAARTVPQFMVGMRELGYQEGRTVHVEYRFADGRMDRLPKLARELVGLNPAVIVAANAEAAIAAYRASRTIPIVCPLLSDAVALGLIASEAHPGGNITGLLVRIPGLAAKDVELVRELRPDADRIGVLTDPKGANADAAYQEVMAASRKLSLEVITAKAGDLPVEFPTKVELAVNLKTTAAIGLVIPPTLLTRADEVIE